MAGRRAEDVRETTIGVGRGMFLGLVLVAVVRSFRFAWPVLSTRTWVHQEWWPLLSVALAVLVLPLVLTAVGMSFWLAGTGSALRRLGSSIGLATFFVGFFEYRARTEAPPLFHDDFAASGRLMWRLLSTGSGLAAGVVLAAVVLIVVMRDGRVVDHTAGSVA